MTKQLMASFRAVAVFTVLTGAVYPLVITGIGKTLFKSQANGSLLERNGKIIGSRLISQKMEDPRFFYPRPSSSDFTTVPSGASNLSPASASFQEALEKRAKVMGNGAPADLLTASGSGLDPDISPESARFQVARIVHSRSLSPEKAALLNAFIEEKTEKKTFGVLGQARVNVLELNLGLEERLSLGK